MSNDKPMRRIARVIGGAIGGAILVAVLSKAVERVRGTPHVGGELRTWFIIAIIGAFVGAFVGGASKDK